MTTKKAFLFPLYPMAHSWHCIPIPFKDYETSFEHLTLACRDDYTYVKWECTPSKKTVCDTINNLWVEFKEDMLQQDDGITSVNMLHFEKVEVIKKDGLVTRHLQQISTSANLSS